MIHIATVHWKDDCWVDIQLKYLQHFVREPFKVYTFLNHLPNDHSSKFFYSSTEAIESHAVKLNLLADMAALHSRNHDDWLIFIDGDAFPIADILNFGSEKLKEFPLIAVQRQENFGDIQPHPSFCMTTLGFWKDIQGDWKSGYRWRNSRGESVTDVGGNLLGLLKERKIEWLPLLRSNKRELHPLYFGIYDDLVYHHGAGFREPYSRVDALRDGKIYDPGKSFLHRRLRSIIYHFNRPKTVKRNQKAVQEMFVAINEDFNFYKVFI